MYELKKYKGVKVDWNWILIQNLQEKLTCAFKNDM